MKLLITQGCLVQWSLSLSVKTLTPLGASYDKVSFRKETKSKCKDVTVRDDAVQSNQRELAAFLQVAAGVHFAQR